MHALPCRRLFGFIADDLARTFLTFLYFLTALDRAYYVRIILPCSIVCVWLTAFVLFLCMYVCVCVFVYDAAVDT